MIRLLPLHLYRFQNTPEETFRRSQGDIRVRLQTKLPKRADETQMVGKKGGESIVHKRHALK